MKSPDMSRLKRNVEHMARRLKLMGHPERLMMLCRMDEGEVSVTELTQLTGLSQSAVSQHLALLREAQIVATRGEAQTRWYRLTNSTVSAIIHALCEICEREAG